MDPHRNPLAHNPLVPTNEEEEQPRTLRDRFYPARAAQPSCIRLPPTLGNNAHFELKTNYISMLPPYHGFANEDAYLFIREFEEVCALMKVPQLTEDAVKLRFITFSLKEQAKRWLLSLPKDSISTWEQFTVVFLRKFFPSQKTNKLKNEILQFRQRPNESFAKLMERFQDLLQECPHHGIDLWHLCQIIYDGIDYHNKQLLESMCPNGFTSYSDETKAWEFLLDLADRTREWESSQEGERTNKGCFVESSVVKEAHLDSLINRLETMMTKARPAQANQVGGSVSMCGWCQSPHHVMEECPNYGGGSSSSENVSAMYQGNPYSNTYNPGWRNHPNFAWNQRENQAGPSQLQSHFGPPKYQAPEHFARPPPPPPPSHMHNGQNLNIP